MRKVLVIACLLLTSFSLSLQSQEEQKLLFTQLNAAKHDTTRAILHIKIASYYAQDKPDSSFYWLNKTRILKPCNCSADSTLTYYKGLAHSERAKVYIIQDRHLQWALQEIDTAVNILTSLLEDLPKPWLRQKALKTLATSYSLDGKVNLLKGNLKNSIDSYRLALNALDSLGHKEGMAKMNNNLGVLNRRLSNHAQAIEHFHAALNFFQNNNDTVAAAGVLTNMGAVSNDIGAYEKSLENYFAALKILEEFKEENSLAVTLVNIGGVLVDSKNIEQSIPYYNRALKLFEKLNDERNKATTLLSLGVAYKEGGLLDSAFHYFTKSELLFKQLNNQMGRADALNEIGQVLLATKNYAAARRHFNKALSIASDIELHSVVANVYYQLAKLEFELSKLEKARLYASMSIDSSKKYDMLLLQKDGHGLLSSIYEKMGEMSLSLYHHKQFFALNDSLYGWHRAHKFAEMEAVYRLEENELTIERLKQENKLKDVSLHNAELKILWQKAQTYIILGVLLFLTVIMYLLYRQFKLNRKTTSQLRLHNSEILQKNEEITVQKEEIEAQRNVLELQQETLRDKSEQLERFNWLITESIDYASSIQLALLPSKEVFESYFSEHFIMYFPKDVVSGDFYWAYPKGNTITIALGDCTGHGVPGGFMSMLGISALTEFMGRQIEQPSELLDNLRLLVIESLKQEGIIGEHQEGMDISIIQYTKGDGFVEFAGANQPLWILKKNSKGVYEFNEQKGDRMPVSYHQRMRPFSSFRIDVDKGDQLFIFSDGYRHQLGGLNFSEKFGKARFISLITENANKSMDEQKNIIEDTFFRWVEGNDQLDDITIIGLKI